MSTTTTFNTIHIFGFGVIQAINNDANVQTKKNTVAIETDALIADIYSKRPSTYTGDGEYHAINIFKGLFADWQTKTKGVKGFRIKYEDLDATLIEALATAVFNTNVPPTQPTPTLNPPTP